jgi:broad specificity phosphatase PhoE
VSRKFIFLLRHGETDISRTGVYCGTSAGELTDKGLEDAQAWHPAFAGLKQLQVISSPWPRATTTAQAIGHEFSLWDDLREWGLGDLEGRPAGQFREENPGWNLFRFGPPNESGESLTSVSARARKVTIKILENLRGDSTSTLVVSHGQFIKVLASNLLQIPLDSMAAFAKGPAGVSIIEVAGAAAPRLLAWNLPPGSSISKYLEGFA